MKIVLAKIFGIITLLSIVMRFVTSDILHPLYEKKEWFIMSAFVSFWIMAYFFITSEEKPQYNKNITPKKWLKYSPQITIRIKRTAYNSIKKSIGSMPAETVGFLIGDPSNYTITDFIPHYNDKYSRTSAYYDYDFLLKIHQTKTSKSNRVLGLVHSHPIDEHTETKIESKVFTFPTLGKLSPKDIESSNEMLQYCRNTMQESYKEMPFMLEGIVFSCIDNENIFRLFLHRVMPFKKVDLFLPYTIID